jgi:phage protein U
MFAQLGDIRFHLPAYVTSTDIERGQTFARHELIDGKPAQQGIGAGLERIVMEVLFHVSFANPELEIDRLEAAADRQQALALVYGNGAYRGRYVITKVTEKVRNTDADGSLVKMTARIELEEWHEPPGREQTIDRARNEGRVSGANSASRTLPPPAGPAPGSDPAAISLAQITRRP